MRLLGADDAFRKQTNGVDFDSPNLVMFLTVHVVYFLHSLPLARPSTYVQLYISKGMFWWHLAHTASLLLKVRPSLSKKEEERGKTTEGRRRREDDGGNTTEGTRRREHDGGNKEKREGPKQKTKKITKKQSSKSENQPRKKTTKRQRSHIPIRNDYHNHQSYFPQYFLMCLIQSDPLI